MKPAIIVPILCLAAVAISADAPAPTNQELRVFIENTRRSIRSFSKRCTPEQRKTLKAHAEFFGVR